MWEYTLVLHVHSHLSISPTFSLGLLAALLDLPAADSSQGNEQHQQTYSQANSYPQSHRRERNVLTWSRKGRGRKSLIIHSCSAKIRVQLSLLYPSPLSCYLTILLLEFLAIKNLNYQACRSTKAKHDDTDDDYCHHHHHQQHCHIDSILGLTFRNTGTVRENRYYWENLLDVNSKSFFTTVQLRHLSLSIEPRWQIVYQSHKTVLSFQTALAPLSEVAGTNYPTPYLLLHIGQMWQVLMILILYNFLMYPVNH